MAQYKQFEKHSSQGGGNPLKGGLVAALLLCFLFLLSALALIALGLRAGLPLWGTVAAAAALLLSGLFGVGRLYQYARRNDAAVSGQLPEQLKITRLSPHAGQEQANPAEINAVNQEFSSFSFTVSHEIKAPVRAIDGYARIFLEDYGALLPDEGRGMVQSIRNICKETIELTNKLLEFTRFAQNEPNNEVVDMQGLIQEVFSQLHPSGSQLQLGFVTSIPHVLGDPMLLRQALVNILSNSVKFTRDKAQGMITAGYQNADGQTVFFIRDNGAGFDMKYSQNLFGMFQRMHSNDEFEGTGIGLSIVKKIIQLHKGRVWITGEVGCGATVYFTLPSDRVLL